MSYECHRSKDDDDGDKSHSQQVQVETRLMYKERSVCSAADN